MTAPAEMRAHRWHWRWLRRKPSLWVAPCRDEAGRRGKLVVALIDRNRLALVVPQGGVAVLDLLTVGGLRAALRDAALAIEEPDVKCPLTYPVSLPRVSA